MKQVIIRIIPSVTTVYDVIYGRIVDGQFAATPIDDTEYSIPPFVHCSSLLGGTSYIEASDFAHFINYYSIRCENIRFYPNMIVFDLINPCNNDTQAGEEE